MRFKDILAKVAQWSNYQTVTTKCIMDTFGVTRFTAYRVVKTLDNM